MYTLGALLNVFEPVFEPRLETSPHGCATPRPPVHVSQQDIYPLLK